MHVTWGRQQIGWFSALVARNEAYLLAFPGMIMKKLLLLFFQVENLIISIHL